MTKSEYDAYAAAVAAFLSREGIDGFSCGEDCEPSFSWRPCDCCARPLGGDRHEVTGYRAGEGPFPFLYSVCSDCVYFEAYGVLDDMTMMDLTDEEAYCA